MSAVTSRKRTSAAVQKPAVKDLSKALFGELSDLLDKAAEEESEKTKSGYATRLLCVAHDLASQAATESWIGRRLADGVSYDSPDGMVYAENVAYDIAALVSAALSVPGDETSAERAELISKARNVLVELTDGDEDVLNEYPPGHAEPLAEANERLALASAAGIELLTWAKFIAPPSIQAIRETGAGGLNEDRIDYFNTVASIFKTIIDTAEVIYFSGVPEELTLEELRKCVVERHSLTEVHALRHARKVADHA